VFQQSRAEDFDSGYRTFSKRAKECAVDSPELIASELALGERGETVAACDIAR